MKSASKSAIKPAAAETNADEMDDDLIDQLVVGITNLETLVLNLRQLVTLIINVAYDLQGNVGDINLVKVPTFSYGLWNLQVCVNANTAEFHTEKNCVFTMITITQQTEVTNTYNLLFKLKNKYNLGITLTPGVYYLFSGKCLIHRQACIDNNVVSENIFSILHRIVIIFLHAH